MIDFSLFGIYSSPNFLSRRTLLSLILLLPLCSFALKPKKDFISHPDSIGLKYHTHWINSSDEVKLHAWELPATREVQKRTTLILAYGDAGNKSYWLKHAAFLAQSGYRVILFDYRGFGQSSSFPIDENFLFYNEFAEDLSAVIDWTKLTFPQEKLGLWALSMSTILATKVLADHPVDFLVAEGYVIDPNIIKTRIARQRNQHLKLPDACEDYQSKLHQIEIPILLFSGETDEFMTVEDSREIVAMRPNRQLHIFPGGHMQGFQILSDRWFGQSYIAKINQFIELGVGN